MTDEIGGTCRRKAVAEKHINNFSRKTWNEEITCES